MSEELKLKPCPFCGKPARDWNRTPTKRPRWLIQCTSCTASVDGLLGEPKKEAIALWNRRAPEPRASDELFGKAIKASYEEGIEKGRESVKSEPGTSVIRWTRYDGTPETLPDDGKLILHKPFDRLRICLFHHELDGEENRVSSTFAASVSWRMMLGDLWAYLPEPPEGM